MITSSMKTGIALRDKVIRTAAERYQTVPDYPWAKTPEAAVLRHTDNKKWYALIMEVPGNRVGLQGETYVDIMNVKVDPVMSGSFLMKKGILPAYHMNKENWITILLDGTVPMDVIELLMDVSFERTKAKQTRRGQK